MWCDSWRWGGPRDLGWPQKVPPNASNPSTQEKNEKQGNKSSINIYHPPTRPCPPTPLSQGCQNLDCAPDWLWQKPKNPLYVRPCGPVQWERKKVGRTHGIQPQAQSSLDLRPPLRHYTPHRASFPAVSELQAPGRTPGVDQKAQASNPALPAWASPARSAQGSDQRGPTTGRRIRCPAHPGALGLVQVVPTHSESPRSAPAVRPEPASPWGSRPQTDEIPAKTSAFKGGATEKPAPPEGALARSLRDPSALLKFSREFSSPGLRKAICVFTFLIFSLHLVVLIGTLGRKAETSLKKETGWGERGLGTAGFVVWPNLRKELHWSQSQAGVWGPLLGL